MKNKPDSELIDDENPEWTAEMFSQAKQGSELFPHLIKASKNHAKVRTTIDYDVDIISAFRSVGNNWQARMNDALREWLKDHAL
jgi:uncharacterized protein (DUF4415 family)